MLKQVLMAIPEATQRRVCLALEWCRTTVRYAAKARLRDERLTAVLPTLTQIQPRFGQIRIRKVVCDTLEYVSKNAFHRLWQLLGLQVVPRKRRRSRRRHRLAQLPGLRATAPNEIWCLDFLKDYTHDGRGLRFLSIVDEHPRLCVGLEVERRFRATEVVAVLERLVTLRGTPPVPPLGQWPLWCVTKFFPLDRVSYALN